MDIKEVAKIAKAYALELFESEKIGDLSLEEIELHESTGSWNVAISFVRGAGGTERTYKSVTVDDKTGKVAGLRSRTGP